MSRSRLERLALEALAESARSATVALTVAIRRSVAWLRRVARAVRPRKAARAAVTAGLVGGRLERLVVPLVLAAHWARMDNLGAGKARSIGVVVVVAAAGAAVQLRVVLMLQIIRAVAVAP